jgi:hypothetical protein
VLDVGLNRPFKFYYQEASQEFVRTWAMTHLPGDKPKPTREIVAGWISHGWSHIDQDMIQNTWRHCDYIAMPSNSVDPAETLEKDLCAVEGESTVNTAGSTTIS